MCLAQGPQCSDAREDKVYYDLEVVKVGWVEGLEPTLLIMLIADQLGLANSDVFGQGILEIGQGRVSEKSGNFTFYSLWEP